MYLGINQSRSSSDPDLDPYSVASVWIRCCLTAGLKLSCSARPDGKLSEEITFSVKMFNYVECLKSVQDVVAH